MNNIFKMTIFLLLMAYAGFTQQNKLVIKFPEKGTLQQVNNLVGHSDSSTTKTFDVAEGKKGLNAVNVKLAKQAGSINENGRTTKPNGQDDGNPFLPQSTSAKVNKSIKTNSSGVDSTTTNMQTKHAINTKGSGATRDK